MKLENRRILSNAESTIGYLLVDGKPICWTCEDQKQLQKVKGETRIPEGEYVIKLRTEGGHHEKYGKMFSFHKGMLELQNVPNFQYILIHIGNTEKDTDGCILVGDGVNLDSLSVTQSTIAYSKLYQKVIGEILKGSEVKIKITDIEPK